MARLRTQKGFKASHDAKDGRSRYVKSAGESKKASASTGAQDVLAAQIKLLGGDEQDLELVKDVEVAHDIEPSEATEDPALSKDVAKFLKGLKTKKNSPAEHNLNAKADRPSAKGKQKRPQQKEETSTIPPVVPPARQKSSKSRLLVEPASQWYIFEKALPLSSSPLPSISPSDLSTVTSRASSLHSSAIATYQSTATSTLTSSNADYSFLQQILQSGTLSDRLSAMTLLVQSSPLYNTKALESLKNMAERGKGKGGREESLKALRCIVDWWVGGGAPSRKLKYFRDQPLRHPSVTDQHLLVWYFEDWLKKYFFAILQILETLSLDPLTYVRMQALSLIYTLLRDKPEQEHNLLRLLVNKLGDSEKSVCSRASFHILQLLQTHPSMKGVIVREMTALILRPTAASATLPSSSQPKVDSSTKAKDKAKAQAAPAKKSANDHARYYATITFNQIVFRPKDKEVAVQCIDVYFQMFRDLIGEDRAMEEGREADAHDGEGEEPASQGTGGDDSQRKKRSKRPSTQREVRGEAGFAEANDYYSKLISAILTGVNRALPFAKLSAADVGLNKHIDTLFLITHTSTFNNSLQALVLIQQIAASLSSEPATAESGTFHKTIIDRYYRTLYDSLHDGRLFSSSKQAMYLNLLFKSLKADSNIERVKSFVRRFVQVLVSGGGGGTEFIVGGLYLLGELLSTIPGLRDMLKSRSSSFPSDKDKEEYDPRKRDPQFAHPSSSPLYELIPLLYHYHPAISLHAHQLLNAQPISSSADLSLNTLSHFLDRFVYKNPKKPRPRGASAMQPAAAATDGTSVKLVRGDADVGALVNEEKFWRRKVEDVPVDEVFFHKYFSKKHERDIAKSAKAANKNDASEGDSDLDAESDAESDRDSDHSVDDQDEPVSEADSDENLSDLDEDEVWKAMKATMPQAEGDDDISDDSDSDDVPSDLDEEGSKGDEEDDKAELEASDDESADAFSLAEGSDNEDLVDLDDDVPDGLIEYDGSDADDDGGADGEDEWGGFEGGQKRKRIGEDKGARKKKLRSLPTFASYEDYAKMIDEGAEDDI